MKSNGPCVIQFDLETQKQICFRETGNIKCNNVASMKNLQVDEIIRFV